MLWGKQTGSHPWRRIECRMPVAFRSKMVLGFTMKMSGQARRRWFGGVVLGLALAMLVLGQTVLIDNLKAQAFLLYWAVCFILTMAAIVVAFRDVKEVQQKVGREQRDLLEGTLGK